MKIVKKIIKKILRKRKKLPLPKVVRLDLSLEGFPLNNFKIVQISDIHIGEFVDHSYCTHIVERTNDLQADLVVFTGDLVSYDFDSVREKYMLLQQINAPLGKYGVLGNRELSHNTLQECKTAYNQIGITLLNNECVVLEKSGKKFNLLGVLEQNNNKFGEFAPNQFPTIMLAHQPKIVKFMRHQALNPLLLLCGHTHCGQIFPFGNRQLRAQKQPFQSGINVIGKTKVYVNCGAGYTIIPFRFLTHAEIALFEINSNCYMREG